MRKQLLLVSLCAVSLLALGCKDPVVKEEMEKAATDLKAAGHETAEAARAAGREAAADVKAETEHLKQSASGSGTETPPVSPTDGK
jgi:hypothetical protein